MMKSRFCKVIYLTTLMACLCSPLGAKRITMSKEVLMDKIQGGWAGQVIGCTYGGPTEFRYNGRIIDNEVKLRWDNDLIKEYYEKWQGLYDDIYMDLTFVQVFEDKGLDAPIEDFANAFAHAGYPLWHANQSARYNIMNGIMPPASGHWHNNPHADDIDFQIEADYAGLMSPGMPQAALHYSDGIGHMMCHGDGWYGGVYVATMYSLAFVKKNIQEVVREGIKAIPQESSYYKCMTDVIKWYYQNPTDWKATWKLIQDKWGTAENCPEGMDAALNIDAKINSAYVIMGLLYGNGDYTQTIHVSTRCGQDSDCNPSTAAGILGTLIGYKNIPLAWKNCLPPVENQNFAHTNISLKKAYDLSFKHALEVIQRNGGKVSQDKVSIKQQPIATARYEKSFEGMEAYKTVNMQNKPIDKLGEIQFEGCGVVLRGYIQADDINYVGLVDVYIDGKKVNTMKLPADGHNRSNDIYWNFGLQEGKHTLKLVRTNCQDNVKTVVQNMVLYKKEQK